MSHWILFLSLAAGAVLLAAAVGVIVKKHCRDTGLLCVRETWVTALLGAMLIALGFAFPVMKLMDNTLAGTGSQSQWIVAAFSSAVPPDGRLYPAVYLCQVHRPV